MTLGNRIHQAMKIKGLNKNALARKIGIHPTTLKNWIDNKTNPDSLKLGALCQSLEINKTWLLTGTGEMSKITIPTHDNARIMESFNIKFVPLISQYAYAGYLSGFADPEYLSHQPTVALIGEYTPGNYVGFEVKGDSMDDGSRRSILEGDVVIGRELYREHWTHRFRKGEVFIIVHKQDGICLKEVTDQNLETGEITLHSWNPDPEYRDFKISLNDVFQIFYVKELKRKIS